MAANAQYLICPSGSGSNTSFIASVLTSLSVFILTCIIALSIWKKYYWQHCFLFPCRVGTIRMLPASSTQEQKVGEEGITSNTSGGEPQVDEKNLDYPKKFYEFVCEYHRLWKLGIRSGHFKDLNHTVLDHFRLYIEQDPSYVHLKEWSDPRNMDWGKLTKEEKPKGTMYWVKKMFEEI